MRKLALTLTVISLLLTCGCTAYREIDRGYLVTAIGFKSTNVGVGIIAEAVSSSDTLDKPSEKTILSSEGATVTEAYSTLESQLVKPLYFEQLGAVVVDDTLNDETLNQILDFFGNLQSVSLGVYVVKTSDITSLFNLETDDGVLGYDIIGIIKNYEKKQSQDMQNQLYQLKRRQSSDKTSSLPSVNVIGDKLNLKIRGD